MADDTSVTEENVTPESEAIEEAEVAHAPKVEVEAIEEAAANEESLEESITGKRLGVPEISNKSDFVEPGSWQAEKQQQGIARTKGGDPRPEGLKPKASIANQVPADTAERTAQQQADDANYRESDVFAWANNLVQYKDELKCEMFLFNKNYVMYRTARKEELDKQMEPIFVDGLLEYVLEGAEQGLIVRGFEDAAAEEKVLQRTRVSNVEKLRELLGWLRTQEHEIQLFNEEEHDIKRIKGVVARISHKEMREPFYVVKALPQGQVMKGSQSWMLRGDRFVPFDADAALKVPNDNQLLVIEGDLYVFSEPKLKALFGYDAKEAAIADGKVREIEEHFNLSFAEGQNLQTLLKGKKATIKKLQKVDPTLISQEQMMDHNDELGVGLMQDDNGRIIIMDDKDLVRFVNLMNDDYMESAVTGIRYEIQKKRELKPPEEDELLKEVS